LYDFKCSLYAYICLQRKASRRMHANQFISHVSWVYFLDFYLLLLIGMYFLKCIYYSLNSFLFKKVEERVKE